jgi:hypothetical protein
VLRIEPGASGFVARNSDHQTTEAVMQSRYNTIKESPHVFGFVCRRIKTKTKFIITAIELLLEKQ